jgi:glutathione peroxidase
MNMRFKRWSVTGATAAALALLAVGVALFNLLDGGVTDALGPIAVLAEPKGADRATDARAADDKGQAFLPVPAPLDDDRVVDAIGPLIKLSCNRDDPESDAGGARSGVAVNALDAPLASYSPEAQAAATGPLLAAAVAPLAPVAAPTSSNAARGVRVAATDMPADCPPLLRHQFNRLQTGDSQSLCQFRGKVLLIVNTASYCGYTGQYEGLEAMYRKYKGRGLVVVGFPSNDFGGQEPGTNQEIAQFCRLTYGVQFPMFEKSSVTKVGDNPLFAALTASTGVAPQWNFYKYVVDRQGRPVAGFGSRTTPDNRELVQLIERALAEKSAD